MKYYKIKEGIAIYFFLFCVLAAIMSISLAACENTIIKTWWVDEDNENDPDYVAIIKDIPIMVYQTIVEEKIIYETIYEQLPPEIKYEYVYVDRPLPPEVLLQHINISDIQFVIFAGESVEFNGPPGTSANTALTEQEKKRNTSIIDYFADKLYEDERYFAIFHGHANSITGEKDEIQELERISASRAADTVEELYDVYKEKNYGDPDALNDRVTSRGYGGGMSMSSSTSSYAGLNRRVEAILFTIETDKVLRDMGR